MADTDNIQYIIHDNELFKIDWNQIQHHCIWSRHEYDYFLTPNNRILYRSKDHSVKGFISLPELYIKLQQANVDINNLPLSTLITTA